MSFAKRGSIVSENSISRMERMLLNHKGGKVTMGSGVPRQKDGAVGDITVRKLADGLRCYIKTDSGWYDINSLKAPDRVQWIPMRLAGNWATDATFGEPQYFRDSNGFVHLRGGVDTGSVGNVITTLPEGYRPQIEQRRLVNRDLDSGTLYIQIIKIATNGEIKRFSGWEMVNSTENVDLDSTAEIPFDGISFFAGQKIIGSTGGGSSLSG